MSLVGDHIASLKPYEPGKPIEEVERELGITGSIKLASNENPLGPSPAAIEALREHAAGVHIYPDGGAFRLKQALSEFHGISADEIVTGNGSNEVLELVVRTFCEPGDSAVISDYSFIAYRLILQAANVEVRSVPMADGLVHELEAMADAVDETTKVVFVANPNNPTGTHVGRAALERFLRAVDERVVVVLDEAYVEYVQAEDWASGVDLRDLRERLVVCRTFSKCYGLAGLRVGYGIAPPDLVDYVNRVREPFNCNLLGQYAAVAAIGDQGFVERSVASNEAGRAQLEKGLADLADLGVRWTPSQTNFLLVETPRHGREVYDAMLRRGVIVRPVGGYGLHDYLRITIGTREQNQKCLDALTKSVGGGEHAPG